MPNYSAYNVNPLPFKQTSVGNLMTGYGMLDRNRQWRGSQDLRQQRINEMSRRTDIDKNLRQQNTDLNRQRLDMSGERLELDRDWRDIKKGDIKYQRNLAAANYINAIPPEQRDIAAPRVAQMFGVDTKALPTYESTDTISMPVDFSSGDKGNVSLKGTPQGRQAVLAAISQDKSILKDPTRLSKVAAANNVVADIKRTAYKADTSQSDRKERKEDFTAFKDSLVENMLLDQGIYKDKNGMYYTDGGADELDPSKRTMIPAGQQAVQAKRRANAMATRIKQYADKNNMPYNEGLLEYQMKLAEAAAKRKEKEIAGEKQSARESRSMARERSLPTVEAPPPVAQPNPQSGFWDALNRGEIGSAYDAVSAWNERRKRAAERIGNIQ